jgi:hypothetical protein
VYDYYASLSPPWSRQQVDDNIFNAYAQDQTSFSQLDQSSIMMYPIPKELTTNGFEIGWNRTLSQTDKDFIRQMYP